MTQIEALVSLNLVPEIGSIRLKKLLEFFGKPENILKGPPERLTQVSGIAGKIAHKIYSLKKEDLDKEFVLAKKHGLKILTQDDKNYPENLKNIYDPPIVLYVLGEIRPEDKIAIAIVGSRRASFYGLTNAQKFAADLSEKGFTIVSGMARGIDTYAHRGALKVGGRTIAVMGSGFNHIYPVENKELAQEISKSGAVISEFPINTEPFKQNFPQRNRVISGLSMGILIAEAARNSGALITADFALEQGREVFALPGKVDSNTSFGTNGLIKQGAKLVENADDIIEELEPILKSKIKELKANQPELAQEKEISMKPQSQAVLELDLGDEEGKVFDLISDQSIQIDELVEKTNMDISNISDILLRLQMKRLVRQLPGKQFVRKEDEK